MERIIGVKLKSSSDDLTFLFEESNDEEVSVYLGDVEEDEFLGYFKIKDIRDALDAIERMRYA